MVYLLNADDVTASVFKEKVVVTPVCRGAGTGRRCKCGQTFCDFSVLTRLHTLYEYVPVESLLLKINNNNNIRCNSNNSARRNLMN